MERNIECLLKVGRWGYRGVQVRVYIIACF